MLFDRDAKEKQIPRAKSRRFGTTVLWAFRLFRTLFSRAVGGKGLGFSRAVNDARTSSALAAEVTFSCLAIKPAGLKPGRR